MKAQRLLYGNSEWELARFSEERPERIVMLSGQQTTKAAKKSVSL